MAVTNIANEHHVVRFVKRAHLRTDEDGNVIGVNPAAFELRPNESYLSASHLEGAGSSRAPALSALRRCFESKFDRIQRAAFSTGNVGAIKAACAHLSKIRVTSEPQDWNPAYATVRRFPPDDIELREQLAAETWADWTLLSKLN